MPGVDPSMYLIGQHYCPLDTNRYYDRING